MSDRSVSIDSAAGVAERCVSVINNSMEIAVAWKSKCLMHVVALRMWSLILTENNVAEILLFLLLKFLWKHTYIHNALLNDCHWKALEIYQKYM